MHDASWMPLLESVCIAVLAVIALLCLGTMLFAVLSRRFADKLLAVNLIMTLSLDGICILAIYLREDYILDTALVYALLGFGAVSVLCKLFADGKRKEEKEK